MNKSKQVDGVELLSYRLSRATDMFILEQILRQKEVDEEEMNNVLDKYENETDELCKRMIFGGNEGIHGLSEDKVV